MLYEVITECLRTCPHDNITVNLRPFSADLARPSAKLDEAFKAFIMLGSAMIYAGILLGPWGAVKDAAYHVGTGTWYIYAAAFTAVIFVVLPVPFAFCASRITSYNVCYTKLLRERKPLDSGLTGQVGLSEELRNVSVGSLDGRSEEVGEGERGEDHRSQDGQRHRNAGRIGEETEERRRKRARADADGVE